MALHGDIRVNGRHIGEWEVVRIAACVESPQPDDVLDYSCMVRQDSTLEGNPAVLETFEVKHRYGDGALALAAKVLTRAQELAKPEV